MPPPSANPRPRSHRLRIGRHSTSGGIYLVTFTTIGREPLFGDFAIASETARELSGASTWPDARLLAWVLMPDHWHGLVELGSREPLARCVARVKSATTRCVNRSRGSRGSIWSDGYHDRGLRRDEDLVAYARYIVMNPLRAGIARRVGNYPFWDAIWL